MSLARRLVHGAGLGLVEHAVRTAALFVTVPLMVKWLGVDDYGYWLAAMSALAYFGLLDLGMSFGTTRFMALAVGAKDKQHDDQNDQPVPDTERTHDKLLILMLLRSGRH